MDNWVPIQDALSILQDPSFSWLRATHLKHVTIRVDTRDTHCRIFDRDGKVITLEDLKSGLRSSPQSEKENEDSLQGVDTISTERS